MFELEDNCAFIFDMLRGSKSIAMTLETRADNGKV